MRTHVLSKGALFAALFCGAGVTGCADLQRATQAYQPAAVNVESPVAATVIAAQTAPLPTPSFRDVPPKVETAGLPTPFQWSRTVQQMNRSGGDITVWIDENPSLAETTTDVFNAGALKELKFSLSDAPPPEQAQISEGFAQGSRTAAAAPPPPK